jgi:hypothetical protein
LINILSIKTDTKIKLYPIGNTNLKGEFSNQESLKSVEDDVKKFSELPAYKKLKLSDLNLKDKNAGAMITQ